MGASHARPFHPQTCGKVERFHQTLKQRLAAQNPPATLAELQTQLDVFRHLYNHQRPHRALDRATPAQVWTDTPKSGPADRPLTPARPTTVKNSTVQAGMVRIGDRHRITIGARYNNATALVITTGTACHIFINGDLIRALTIDPTREHQPLYNRPGRPTHQP